MAMQRKSLMAKYRNKKMVDQFIQGHQLGVLKPGLSYPEFEKVMKSKPSAKVRKVWLK